MLPRNHQGKDTPIWCLKDNAMVPWNHQEKDTTKIRTHSTVPPSPGHMDMAPPRPGCMEVTPRSSGHGV